MATKLVFSKTPLTNPAHLVFGETDGPDVDSAIDIDGRLSGFRNVAVEVGDTTEVRVEALITGLRGAEAQVSFDLAVERPVVGEHTAAWESALQIETPLTSTFDHDTGLQQGHTNAWDAAIRLEVGVSADAQNAIRIQQPAMTAFEEAVDVQRSFGSSFEDVIRIRQEVSSAFENAVPLVNGTTQRFEDAYRDRRQWAQTGFQDAKQLVVGVEQRWEIAKALEKFFNSRYEEAMWPPIGKEVPPIIPPVGEPCYTPNTRLVFVEPATSDTRLVFVCEKGKPPDATVVIPVREVYMVQNNVTLTRVDDGSEIEALSINIALDADSWTWRFSAGIAPADRDLVENEDDSPVEVELTINGQPLRFIIEDVAEDRSFAKTDIAVTGRGKSAGLDAPYAPVLNFSNDSVVTAQQLMAQVLTINGVPLGWDIDWRIVDWAIPAGAFTHNGTYVTALNSIAQAAGAYIQPHDTEDELIVLPRYPKGPWDWYTITPDIELPAALAQRVGISKTNKPNYNRAWVTGTIKDTINAKITRAGTDGALAAPGFTDPLITAVEVARQKGLEILSNTGRIRRISQRYPVLPEMGLVTPGKMVKYVDGGVDYLGIVRSISVDISMPTVWQTVEIETHV